MASKYWPFFDLRITSSRLMLRYPSDDDIDFQRWNLAGTSTDWQRFRLTRSESDARKVDVSDIEIDGFESCRSMFGLGFPPP